MASYSYDDFGDDEDFGLGDGVGVLLTAALVWSLLPVHRAISLDIII